MKLHKLTLASLVITSSLLLSACGGGGGGGSGAIVATAPTVAPINASTGPATVSAVTNKPFTFASGVPALGTTKDTTVTFKSGSNAATPEFSIASAEGTASGTTRFGSCIFAVTASTYPASHPLALGKTTTVNPCAININTVGAAADNTSAPRDTSLVLGATPSTPLPVPVSIDQGGNVAIGGTVVGTTPVAPSTGAGS